LPKYFFSKALCLLLGKGRFESYSAGADPRPQINPYTVRVLRESFKIDASGVKLSLGTSTRVSFLILSSLSAITPKKAVQCGQANRSLVTGHRLILLSSMARNMTPINISGGLPTRFTGALICSATFQSKNSTV